MRFNDGWLDVATPHPTSNLYRDMEKPEWVIHHYTSSRGRAETINWFTEPQAKASAHFFITTDGQIHQFVSLRDGAWHAGIVDWKGPKDMNRRSIGIEWEGDGDLVQMENGHWRQPWSGRQYLDTHVERHGAYGYTKYPDVQIQAGLNLLRLLDIDPKNHVRHSDVSSRKSDPGPAFPLARIQRALARKDKVPPRVSR